MGPPCCLHALLLVLLTCIGVSYASSVGWNFAVIIDAGSTGSRVHVFRYYTASTHSPLPTVELPGALHKTTPGLSAYAFDPKTAARSLLPLLKFAREKVPADQVAQTPVQLMATAGLRRLNNGSAEAIMSEVRALLADSGFEFLGPDGARVLSGSEEGLWGWLAVNYATGALQAATLPPETPLASQLLLGRKGSPSSSSSSSKPAVPLQGVVELGGASLQVTFAAKERLPAGQAAGLVLPRMGADRIYCRSFDGLGLQAALEEWSARLASDSSKRRDPCLPSGYSALSGLQGSSDWGACRSGVKGLLPLSSSGSSSGNCQYKRCGLAGSFLPSLEGSVFVGLDNLFYTAQVLGLPTDRRISVNTLEGAAKKQCSRSWPDVKAQLAKQADSSSSNSKAKDEPYLLKACFSSALIVGVLKEGLGIDGNAPVLQPSNSVQTPKGSSVEVNWALGALLSEVLLQGGRALGRSHDHVMLAAPGSGQGTSDAVAAATAASFCLLMLLLSACANYCRVGVAGGAFGGGGAAAAAALGSGGVRGAGPGSSGSRSATSGGGGSGSLGGVVGGLLGSAVSAAADGSSQSGSRAKYTRLRAVSPNTYAGLGEQLQLQLPPVNRPGGSRPASRPPSMGHSGGGVIEVAAYAAAQPPCDRGSSQGGRVSAGELTARR